MSYKQEENVQSLAAFNKNSNRAYGKTRKYIASKRIQMRFRYKYTDMIGFSHGMRFSDAYQYFKEENEKNVYYAKGFLFIPKDCVIVHYSNTNYVTHCNRQIAKIFNGMRFVKDLNIDQVVETASLMATVKMTTLTELTYITDAWAYYFHNFLKYARDLSVNNSQIEINDRMAYEHLLKNVENYNIIVPYPIFDPEGTEHERFERIVKVEKYGIVNDFDLMYGFPEDFDKMIALVIDKKKRGKQLMDNAKTAAEMCKIFEKYVTGFETDRVVSSYEISQFKLKPPQVYKRCSPNWQHDILKQFVSNIVEGRNIADDLDVSSVKDEDLDEFKQILYRMGSLRYQEFCIAPSLWDLSKNELNKVIVPEHTAEMIDYAKNFKAEADYLKEKQMLLMRLAKNLGMVQPVNIYYNLYNVYYTAMFRRETDFTHAIGLTADEENQNVCRLEKLHPHSECKRVENTTLNFGAPRGDPAEQGENLRSQTYFRRAVEAISSPFQTFKSTMSSLNNTSEEVKKLADKISEKLDDKGFTSMAKGFAEFDSSSISATIDSLKNVANSMFDQALGWVYEQLGLKVTVKVDISDLIITYILWVNTKSNSVKILILGYLAMQFGLLDFFFGMIKKIALGIRDFFNEEDTTFEEAMELEDAQVQALKVKTLESISERAKATSEILAEKEPEESMWDKVIDGLEKSIPVVLGLGVIGVAGTFAVKAAKTKNNADSLGSRVVNVCKNMSYIGLGTLAISNIIKNCIGILKVAFDYIKTYIFQRDDTKIRKTKAVMDFLKNSTYIPGVSNYIFATDPSAAIGFMRDFAMLPKLDSYICEVEDSALRSLYATKRKEMTQMYGSVKAALQVAIQGAEIFHIQFVSEPGAGKTDLSQTTIKTLAKTFTKLRNEVDRSKGLEAVPNFSDDSVYFAMESEKYKDLYFGQRYMIIDEMNFYKAEDAESIQFKLGLFSGKPTVANKAALEDKGMLFNLDMVISNTNNPFPSPDNVLSPQALHRRRILVRARVNPKYLTNNKIDDNKIAQAGINRNLSEHLMFTVLDPVKTPETPIGTDFVDLDYSQLTRYLKARVEKHMLTEESRLSNRLGVYAHMRSHIESMISQIEKATIRNKDVDKIRAELIKLAKTFKEARDKDYSNPDVVHSETRDARRLMAATIAKFELANTIFDDLHGEQGKHMRINGSTEHKDCDPVEYQVSGQTVIVSKCLCCHYEAMRDFRSMIRTEKILETYPHMIADASWLLQNEDTVLAPNLSICHTELKESVDSDGKPYLTLVESKNYKVAAEQHNLDPTKFAVHKIFGRQVITYEGKMPEDEAVKGSVLAAMRRLEMKPSIAEAKTSINKRRERQNAKLLRLTYFERIKTFAKNTYKLVKDALAHYFTRALEAIGNGLQIGIGAFVAIVSVWGLLYGLGRLLHPKTEDTVAYDKSIRTNKISRRFEDTASKSDGRSEHTQKGQVVFSKYDETTGMLSNWANGCCIQGNIFMVPNHFVLTLPEKAKVAVIDPTKVKVNNKEGLHLVDLKRSDFKQIKGKDAALVCIPSLRMFVNLYKKFVTEEQLGRDNSNFTTFQAYYQCYKSPKTFAGMNLTEFGRRIRTDLYVSEVFDGTLDYSSEDRFQLNNNGDGKVDKGDSGGLVIHLNTKTQAQCLLGTMIQRTMYDNQPRCYFITREDLEVTLRQFDVTQKFEVCHFEGENISPSHELYSVFDFKENVYESDRDRSIAKGSGFARTPIFGVFPVETEPAIQSISDPRIQPNSQHYLKVSLNKSNGQNPPYISQDEKKFMMNSLVRHYEQQFPNFIRSLRVYDVFEAVRGTKEVGSVPINIHSSAGLPYCEMPNVKGKSPFIRYDQEQKTYVIQDKILQDVQLYEHLYQTGKIPQNLKLEFTKKELVGPNKITNPKLRTVGTGNLIHQIIYNKINRSLQLILKNAWRQGKSTSFAMGIDLEQHGDQIVKGLKYNDFVYDFDVKAWESAISYELLTMASDVKVALLNKAYAARGQKCSYDYRVISQALVVDYTDCDVSFQDVIYAKKSGLLSGHPGTFIENTDIHIMIVYLIAKRILEKENKPGWANSADIYKNLKIIVAADDIVMAISPLFRPYFHSENIKWGYASVGFEITASDKSPEINVKTIEEIQFLKHKFKKQNEIYVAYPLTSIIYQLFNWFRTDTALGREQLLIQNYSDAFRFAFFVGPEFYEETRQLFNRANLNHKIQWTFTYQEMKAMILQDREEQELLENSRDPMIQEIAQEHYDRFTQ